jgi:hypothetical protein
MSVADRGRTGPEAVQLWRDNAPTVTDLERRLYEMRQTAPDEQRAARAGALVTAVSQLRTSLERDLQLRSSPDAPGQAALIAESAAAVASAHSALNALLPAGSGPPAGR